MDDLKGKQFKSILLDAHSNILDYEEVEWLTWEEYHSLEAVKMIETLDWMRSMVAIMYPQPPNIGLICEII